MNNFIQVIRHYWIEIFLTITVISVVGWFLTRNTGNATSKPILETIRPDAGLSLPKTEQEWVLQILKVKNVDPKLDELLAHYYYKPNWEKLIQKGSPFLFSIGPKLGANPFSTTQNNIGLMFDPTPVMSKKYTSMPVFSVDQDSPAWNAGIRKGDWLTHFNGLPIKEGNLNTIMNEGVQKGGRFSIQPAYGNKTVTHSLYPVTSTATAEFWILNPDTAILRIRTYGIDTPQRVYQLLKRAQQTFRGNHIILDLRSPCGEMVYAKEIAWMLNGGKNILLGTFTNKQQQVTNLYTTPPTWFKDAGLLQWMQKHRYSIYVNQYTALSSEIIAQHLITERGATLYGTKTIGNRFYWETYLIPHQEKSISFSTQTFSFPQGQKLPLIPNNANGMKELDDFYKKQRAGF